MDLGGRSASPPQDRVGGRLAIRAHSGSQSERRLLKVCYTGLAAPGYGQVVTAARQLRRCASYAITVVHLGTNLPEGPDYDYTAHVTPAPGSCAIVDDPQNLLGNWGPNPGGPPDFDGNGSIGASGLLALLANWGRARELGTPVG